MGVIVREVMFHVSKNDTLLHLNGKIERDNKVMYSFQVGSRPNRQMKEFTIIVSLGCITRFRFIAFDTINATVPYN